MLGGVGHTGGLTNPALGVEDAEPVILISVGTPPLRARCDNAPLHMRVQVTLSCLE